MTYDAVLKESLTHRREPSTSSIGFPSDKSVEQQQTTAKSNTDNQTQVRTVRHTHHRSLSKTFTVKQDTNDVVAAKSATAAATAQTKVVKTTRSTPVKPSGHQELEMPQLQVFFTHLCYFILNLFGHLREFLRKYGFETRKGAADNSTDDFAPLFVSYEAFHTRNCYIRNRDCFNRPICSVPGAEIELVERVSDDYNWTFRNTGRTIKALNMGSYNYLGFAENDGPCALAAQASVHSYSVATSSSRQELGTLKCQVELESLVARFLGTEAALTFGMGFGTNALNIPALLSGKNSLILSDELNHVSLILGARLTGATVRVFKHNNMLDLEQKLKKAIIEGMPGNGRPWKKILIIVEGVYSMEGTITPLKEIIELKKKYKAFLYLDEAHSVGALGEHGRGIVDHFGCDPRDVDILMGTFSKSFGAAGGYIAGSRSLIDYLKHTSHAGAYASSMSPPVCTQITKVLEILMGLDGNSGEGKRRIKQLAENVKYFRDKLIKMGFIVYGNPASPVVPAMLFTPPRVALFNRMMLERNIAVVTVGFPATILPGGRVRFCISAAHTRQMLDKVLEAADVCGEWNGVKISKFNPARTFQQVKEMDRDDEK